MSSNSNCDWISKYLSSVLLLFVSGACVRANASFREAHLSVSANVAETCRVGVTQFASSANDGTRVEVICSNAGNYQLDIRTISRQQMLQGGKDNGALRILRGSQQIQSPEEAPPRSQSEIQTLVTVTY